MNSLANLLGRSALLGALALDGAFFAGVASAQSNGLTALQASTQAEALSGLQIIGQTRFRMWGFEVYDAYLWAKPEFVAARYAQHDFALELRYLRDLSGARIAERSLQEMKRVDTFSDEDGKRWLQAMRDLFPDVKTGDRITGVHVPAVGATFYVNGQWRGAVASPEFARLFFGIWLSQNTSQPRMREALLTPLPAAATSQP